MAYVFCFICCQLTLFTSSGFGDSLYRWLRRLEKLGKYTSFCFLFWRSNPYWGHCKVVSLAINKGFTAMISMLFGTVFLAVLSLGTPFTFGVRPSNDIRKQISALVGAVRNEMHGTELAAFKVPASELEARLSEGERTNVQVARQAGPSVAFVTSIWPRANNTSVDTRTSVAFKTNLPPGQGLGSGSAFIVDSEGYLVTNYHVIERAYQLQSAEKMFQSVSTQIAGNISEITGFDVGALLRNFVENSLNIRPPPKVFVRLDSETQYIPCKIVSVKPELDIAVLQAEPDTNATSETFQAMSFGSSSDLLVGQGLIAIGNPFGLDKTVTTGVVSALNREIRTSGNNGIVEQPIRNCIQTDCAINPGNSGGPLLNFQGKVVGVNTAIVSTSGSFSGIGFAVPSDAVQPAVQTIIRHDRLKKKKQTPWLGVEILQVSGVNNQTDGTIKKLVNKNWVGKVARNSPAASAGIRGCFLDPQTARFKYGEAVVAINGRPVPTYAELQTYLEQCAVGEKLAITLEDENGDRRVVYLTLSERPL